MTKADVLARLSARHAQIAASPCGTLDTNTRKAIERTLDALDSPHSYYAVLSADELAQVRAQWRALVDQSGIASRKSSIRKSKPAAVLPPRVLEFFGSCEWLPHRPRAADDYSLGIQPMDWERAQSLRSIELNPPAHIHWLVFDCDHAEHERWRLAGLPQPSFITINPSNGHHHVVYRLHAPVCRSDNAHQHPLTYLRAVKEAMRLVLGGDPCYADVITKNPLHVAWKTIRPQQMPAYKLAELAATVKLEAAGSAPEGRRFPRAAEELEKIGVGGRNCALFDAVRKRSAADKDIRGYAARCNARFAEPLGQGEVERIVKSIERYEASERAVSRKEAFSSLQSARGKLGGRPLTVGKSEPWLAAGISRATFYRYLKIQKEASRARQNV